MRGIHYMGQGLNLIFLPGMKRYVVVPLVINVIVFALITMLGVSLFDRLVGGWVESLPEWMEFVAWLMWLLFLLVMAAFMFFFFTIVANVIAAPFNAILSIRIEDHLRGGTDWRSDDEAPLVMLSRTIKRELEKLRYYLPRIIGLCVISLLPVINFFAPLVWILFGAWMMAVQYTDYGADNNAVGFMSLKERLSENRFGSLGFGVVVYLMMFIPLLNLLVIPAAVAGGTQFWVEKLSR